MLYALSNLLYLFIYVHTECAPVDREYKGCHKRKIKRKTTTGWNAAYPIPKQSMKSRKEE